MFYFDHFLLSFIFLKVPKVITTPWVQPGVCSPDYTSTVNNNLELSGSSGVVLSPLYPSQYPDSISCTWKITVPNGKRIRIEFDDFWIDDQRGCHGDYLEVRDGLDTSSPMLGGKYCGNKNPGEIYSTGSSIRLQFVSDASGTSHGFKARYAAVSKRKFKKLLIISNNYLYIEIYWSIMS